MISRATAVKALKKCNYERFSIAPSSSGYAKGTLITVYFAEEVSKAYPYGDHGKVHGWIAPAKWKSDPGAVQRMIGYSGSIILVNSDGKVI